MKKLFPAFLGALSLFLFALLLPTQDGQVRHASASVPENQQADTVFIQIVADADSVVAVPNSVTVSPGQVVTWTTDLGEWRVRFQSPQPFGETAVSQGIGADRGQRRGQAVRNEAANGRYKYDIMVIVQGGQNLRADPEVVVRRGGGTP